MRRNCQRNEDWESWGARTQEKGFEEEVTSHVQCWFHEQDECHGISIGFAEKLTGDLLKAMVWNDGGRGLLAWASWRTERRGIATTKRDKGAKKGGSSW